MATKTYSRINWENSPSVNTPLSESNLNKMDVALNEIDNRVVDLMNGVSGNDFEGATAQQAGTHGLVPAPAAGDQNKVLKGDGTWGTVDHAGSADTATNATNATNATTATKIGSTTVGSATKPVYINDGTPTPITGDVVTSDKLSDGSVTKVGTQDVGDTDNPVYLHNGIPTAASFTVAKSVPADAKFTDTTYESLPAAQDGTSLSLVTTGEKYLWNNKSGEAGQIAYDNTTSGLQSENVQDAIDELAVIGGGGSADRVSYDNTESGLESENVQDAIDELAILADADQSIVAIWDKSPAIRAHAKDSYVHYNGVTYIVTSAISIGDTLTVGTNIAVPTLEEGTVIYIPEVDGTFTADMVDYDNTTSGLSAADVQHAIDNVVSEKQDKTLSAPIVVGGVSKTTVEGALSGLNGYADNISDVISKNGAKNLNSYPYKDTTKTNGAVTWTDNGDGTVKANGTSSASYNEFIFHKRNEDTRLRLANGTYILSGCPSGGTISSFYIYIVNTVGGSEHLVGNEVGNGLTFTVNGANGYDDFGLVAVCRSGYQMDNKVFKPMITLASQPDSDYAHYVPYSKTNQELTQVTSGLTNPNLLDNPWFTVNQRNVTTFSTAYGVDRWKANAYGATYSSDGLVIAANTEIDQYLEDSLLNFLKGRTVTFSELYSDGTIAAKSGVVPSSGSLVISGIHCQLDVTNKKFLYYSSQAQTYKLRALKLEIGSYSTLHLDTAPNYTTELLKCQRYFYRLQANGSYKILAMGYCETATAAPIFVTLPVGMRGSTQVTTSGTFSIYNGAVNKTVTIGVASMMTADRRELMISTTATDLTAGQVVNLLASDGAYIDFNSEL